MERGGRRIVLFDLDGTLTKSDPGIIGSLGMAYRDTGLPMPGNDELLRFIGPPIPVSLRRNHVPEQDIDNFVRIYRRYYNSESVFDDPMEPGHKVPGMFNNSVYDGMLQQLERIQHHGYGTALASCKPERQARAVCSHFGLDVFLNDIFGASDDKSRTSKAQVISYGLQSIEFDSTCDTALMIGDRSDDVDGAASCGIDCIGCSWGYAQPHELNDHGAYEVLTDIDDLAPCVETYFSS